MDGHGGADAHNSQAAGEAQKVRLRQIRIRQSNTVHPTGSMRGNIEPEIIPPRSGNLRQLDDATLSLLASLLDDMFRIPGTTIRFGLDPVIGLVPGVGDLLTGAASFLIVFAAWQRQLPKVTVARMMANIAIDTLVGTIPIFGDAFDTAWKSNRKNFSLLQRATMDTSRRQNWRDWLFLVGLVLLMLLLIAIPVALLWLAIHLLRRA
jgi:hypothetical protein